MVAALVTGFLTLFLPYISILLAGVLIHTLSNVMHGLATNAWIIIFARFLLGASYRIFKVAALTYVANNESKYIKAYKEHTGITNKQKMEANDDSDDAGYGDYKLEERESEDKEVKVNIKKTAMIILTINNYLPALIGPGKLFFPYCISIVVYIAGRK